MFLLPLSCFRLFITMSCTNHDFTIVTIKQNHITWFFANKSELLTQVHYVLNPDLEVGFSIYIKIPIGQYFINLSYPKHYSEHFRIQFGSIFPRHMDVIKNYLRVFFSPFPLHIICLLSIFVLFLHNPQDNLLHEAVLSSYCQSNF